MQSATETQSDDALEQTRNNVASTLEQKALKAGQSLRDACDTVKVQTGEKKDRAEAAIHRHPFLATMGAFGAGMLATKLINGRN